MVPVMMYCCDIHLTPDYIDTNEIMYLFRLKKMSVPILPLFRVCCWGTTHIINSRIFGFARNPSVSTRAANFSYTYYLTAGRNHCPTLFAYYSRLMP
jgi:hypothetical protein